MRPEITESMQCEQKQSTFFFLFSEEKVRKLEPPKYPKKSSGPRSKEWFHSLTAKKITESTQLLTFVDPKIDALKDLLIS